jgi:galactokinase
VDLVFGGDLPMASGLSSSAAIEVAMAVALAGLHDVRIAPDEIAMMAHRAETGYVGLKCGIMDQFASALGRDGHALLLHCSDRSYEHVPMDPTAFEVLVVDTRKPRNLSSTEFNRRVAECRRAFEALCAGRGSRVCLADFAIDDLEAVRDDLDDVIYRRALHVLREMARVREAVGSLRRGDVARLGQLVSESHESTRVDYAVSCEELDAITDAACQHDSVFGARLTGAGFGGCAFALVHPASTEEVARHVRQAYAARFGIEPGYAVLRAGGGPARLR